MKTKLTLFFSLLLSFNLYQASNYVKATNLPTSLCKATFYYDPIQGDTVTFHNTSLGNIDSVLWSFGDGQYSSEFSPIHVFDFTTDSIYEVCLTISNDSCSDTQCQTIFFMDTIDPGQTICEASFYYEPIRGDTVTFHNTSLGSIDSVLWSFGDGQYSSEFSPIHVFDFSTDSIYQVCLTINNDSCSDTQCQIIFFMDTLTPHCEATFYYDPIHGDTVIFHNTSLGNIDSVLWSFGDGQYSSEFSPIHVFDFSTDSIYQVCQTISNDSCSDTQCQTIFFMDTIDPGQTICEAAFYYDPIHGDTVTFHNTSLGNIDSVMWSFGDGQFSSEFSPIHVFDFTTDSIYQVCLTISNDSCSDTQCQTIFFMDLTPHCEATFYYEPIHGDTVIFHNTSLGNIDSVLWSFGDGQFSSEFSPIHVFDFSTDSIYQVCLTISNDSCADTQWQTIFFMDTIDPGQTICEASFYYEPIQGDTVTFHNTSSGNIDSVMWSFGDGQFSSEFSPIHVFDFTTDSIYQVCLTISNDSCADTYCTTVSYSTSCFVSYSYTYPDTGTTIQFYSYSNPPAMNYYWNFGDSTYSEEKDPAHSFELSNNKEFNVCLEIKTAANCKASFCNEISFDCNADFTYQISNEFEKVALFNNNSTGNITNSFWDFGDGKYSYEKNPIHLFSDSTDHSSASFNVCLTVYDTDNNCRSKACKTINFNDSIIPTGYTVAGTVKAGESGLENGFVLLYKQIDTLTFDAKNATVVDNGRYEFTGIEEGEYILHAIPNTTSNTIYFPTYYTSNLTWKEADILHVNSDYYNVDINLLSFGRIFNGVGSVKGKISSNLESSQPISNVPIILSNTQNNELAYFIPDAFGHFEFNNLDYGTYYLYPETPNTDNIKKIEINITPENYAIKNLQLTFNELATHTISNKVIEPTLIYYSNQKIIIETPDIIFQEGDVRIYNIIGQNLTNKVSISIEQDKIHLTTENLLNGLYIISLSAKDFQYSLKYMK